MILQNQEGIKSTGAHVSLVSGEGGGGGKQGRVAASGTREGGSSKKRKV